MRMRTIMVVTLWMAVLSPAASEPSTIRLRSRLIAWLGTLGESCLAAGPLAITGHNVWCFPFVIILGTAPAIVLWKMLRRGAPLTPDVTAGLGALAAAGVGNFCVRLIHQEDVTLMLLVWHVGGVFLLSILSGTAGRYLLNWRSVDRTS